MKLEHYPVEKLKQEIKEIVGRYLDLEKYTIFFFGSRVDGTSHEKSDIDVGIEGLKEVPGIAMAHIGEEIDDLSILYKVEVVDFKTLGKDFYDVARQHIEIIL